MKPWLLAVCISVVSLMSGIFPAAAQNRHALVIGINAYPGLASPTDPSKGQLVKAINDARAVAATLKDIGFVVTVLEDASRRQISNAIGTMESAIKPGDVVFLYFAGHGLEIESANWLVPGDFPPLIDASGKQLSLRAIKDSTFNAGDIIADFRSRGARTVIAIIDACREFVDARNARSLGLRSGGLGQMAPPDGVFVLMSAGTRQLALDRLDDNDRNPNSVFTRVLLPLLKEPGLTLNALALKLRPKVTQLAASVNHVQRPSYYDELNEPFVLVPAPARAVAVEPRQPPTPNPPSADTGALAELAAWDALKTSTDREAIRRFIATVKNPSLKIAAEARLAQLASAAPAPAQPVATAFNPSRSAKVLTPAEERGLKPRDAFMECVECPEMVVVPAGTYVRGSPEDEPERQKDEGPERRVTIVRAFAVGKFEVTFAEWDECVLDGGCNGYRPEDNGWGRGRQPVINVSWQDAQAYVAWLSRKTRKDYRLLTEAEWEYAARAGTTTPFSFGPTISPDEANYDGSYIYGNGRKGVYRRRTTAVGSFPANAFGLFDMHGNVWEWVADCYVDSYAQAPTNGAAVTEIDCVNRVLRGGSWNYNPRYLRSAFRGDNQPDYRYYVAGFRVARTLSP